MKASVATLLLLSLPHALAAQGGPTDTGLLLGMKSCQECTALSTFWIVRTGDRVQVAASGRGLLVPRTEGFWWVGIRTFDNTRVDSDVDSDSIPCDSLPEESAGDPVDVERSDTYANQPSAVIWVERAGTGSESLDSSSVTAGWAWLDWIGTEWIAFGRRTEDYREHLSTSTAILPFESFADGGARTVRGLEEAARRWRQAVDACIARVRESDPDARTGDWTVRRGPTHWNVRFAFRPFGYDDEIDSCEVPPEATMTAFGHDRVSVSWAVIKNVLPGATTAFQSPSGDLLMVQEDARWYAFLPKGGQLGAAVAGFSLPGMPVMAQWAGGAHVTRWTQEVSPLLEEGPPGQIRFQ